MFSVKIEWECKEKEWKPEIETSDMAIVIAFEAFKSENKSKREPNLIIDLFFAENDVYFLRKII